jgi:citrate synthase
LTSSLVKIDYAINVKTDTTTHFVTAEEAAAWLGVSRATLYAYVSRGLVRSEPVSGSKARRYHRADVEALASRGRGAGPKASASALRFGEPLLESSVALIQGGRLYYRGYDAAALARSQSFEAVAMLLWTGVLGGAGWVETAEIDVERLAACARLAAGGSPIERALAGLMASGVRDDTRFARMREQVAVSGSRVLRTVVALMAPESRVAAVVAARSTAEAFWLAFSEDSSPEWTEIEALDGALVLCADHELNASTFAARVTASTGANLYAVVSAALAALSGPKHGGASDRVEAMLRELEREAGALDALPAAVAARFARGDGVVGYGHPLYPHGDPRFVELRRLCDAVARSDAQRSALARVDAANETARRLGYGEPTLDVGLVALRAALGLPSGAAAALFAVGRTAGWIAHALEQSASEQLLRPRARYVGPPPRA